MFARVAAFQGGDNERIRQMSEGGTSSGQPDLPDGVKRVMVLADEADGTRLFITFFDSKEAIDAAQARFESMGGEIPEEVRGRRTSVDVYEVLADQEV